jgi:hypothetical protein
MNENKVISIFSKRNAEDEENKSDKAIDLEEVQKANAAKAERLSQERKQHNRRVKNEYKLSPKK